MDGSDMTDTGRTRRYKRVSLIVGIMLAILIVVAVGICVGAFVMVSPMIG
jgi:putative Ca2+/H+ antiporter (TMEM165/GDT1 family)